jgi:hypothetical protein
MGAAVVNESIVPAEGHAVTFPFYVDNNKPRHVIGCYPGEELSRHGGDATTYPEQRRAASHSYFAGLDGCDAPSVIAAAYYVDGCTTGRPSGGDIACYAPARRSHVKTRWELCWKGIGRRRRSSKRPNRARGSRGRSGSVDRQQQNHDCNPKHSAQNLTRSRARSGHIPEHSRRRPWRHRRGLRDQVIANAGPDATRHP